MEQRFGPPGAMRRNRLHMLVLLTACWVAAASWLAISGVRARISSDCHLRELELCTVGATALINSPAGLPTDGPIFVRQCELLDESTQCAANFTERCLTEQQLALAHPFLENLIGLKHDFCTNGTDFRKEYQQHAVCLHKVQKQHQRRCMTDLQAGFERIHKVETTTRLCTGCCNINRFMSCLDSQIEKQCGTKALEFVQKVHKRLFGSVVRVFCHNHKPSSKECTALLPPEGTPPGNGRGTSALTRFITSLTVRADNT